MPILFSAMPAKRHAPATARNRDPILSVLRQVLPERGRLLEIASGTGEHAAWFAPNFPGLTWQPSDLDDDNLDSIAAWVAEAGLANLLPPLRLDVTAAWPDGELDAIFNANMIHISPWDTAIGLMQGAGRHLAAGGVLVVYGPFRLGGAHVSDSNRDFDDWLRAQDPRWGVRDLEAVADLAAGNGLALDDVVEMPANNRTVVLRKE